MPPADSVRADAFLFYSMAISSFIESTTPEYVVNLARIFDKDPQMKSWLGGTWLEKLATSTVPDLLRRQFLDFAEER